ncbi:uncharacterized protein UHOD_02370 [Ustilago sp. UG-2017b]|nr:uncharacterized protein UHOD_02370 [Ustilago sp. UG-2017b]
MHTFTPLPWSTSISLADLDSDNLLHLLLQSVPSAQTRPDLHELDPNEDELWDELRATPAPPTALYFPHLDTTQYRSQALYGSESLSLEKQGMLENIGALFCPFKSRRMDQEDDSTTIQSEDTPSPAPSTTAVESDVEEELQVEYMVIAERCVTVRTTTAASAASEEKGKAGRAPSRRKRRSTASASAVVLTSPPVILRRRTQIVGMSGEKRRKRGRAMPGFK